MNPKIAALAELWRDAQPYADGGWATFSYVGPDHTYRCRPMYTRDLEGWLGPEWEAQAELHPGNWKSGLVGWRWDDGWEKTAA